MTKGLRKSKNLKKSYVRNCDIFMSGGNTYYLWG